jgi:hypothetical protein
LLSLIERLIASDMPSAVVDFSDYTERTGYISCPLRLYFYTVYKYSTYTMTAWQENSAFKSILGKLLLGIALAVLAPQGFAKPAVWYWWASNSTDHRVCAQTSPGAGWFRESTAFRDSGCSIRVKAF